MTYDLRSPEYADSARLTKELERVFDVCHGCRLCHDLCPSFGTVFDRVDQEDGDVTKLVDGDWKRVTDECYQCKAVLPQMSVHAAARVGDRHPAPVAAQQGRAGAA